MHILWKSWEYKIRQVFWDINENVHDPLQYSIGTLELKKLFREIDLEIIYFLKDDDIEGRDNQKFF